MGLIFIGLVLMDASSAGKQKEIDRISEARGIQMGVGMAQSTGMQVQETGQYALQQDLLNQR